MIMWTPEMQKTSQYWGGGGGGGGGEKPSSVVEPFP